MEDVISSRGGCRDSISVGARLHEMTFWSSRRESPHLIHDRQDQGTITRNQQQLLPLPRHGFPFSSSAFFGPLQPSPEGAPAPLPAAARAGGAGGRPRTPPDAKITAQTCAWSTQCWAGRGRAAGRKPVAPVAAVSRPHGACAARSSGARRPGEMPLRTCARESLVRGRSFHCKACRREPGGGGGGVLDEAGPGDHVRSRGAPRRVV